MVSVTQYDYIDIADLRTKRVKKILQRVCKEDI
jgi:hypothetical protein